MSANQSNLSNSHYGYDFVVATTQESINGTMKEYLYNTSFPVVQMYWNQDANGNPVAVSRDVLLTQTNGTDPLTVPSWNSGDPITQDIKNISQSDFYFAFEAAIGIPSEMQPADIPDIITLQAASQSVIFNLICSEFTLVTCNFGRKGLTSFFSTTQPNDSPWLFTSTVALKSIFDNSNLPANVQAQLDNFGPNAFSVQQLIFDLDNAALESTPTINGVEPGTPTYTLLSQVFLGAYFTAMKTVDAPVLNYSIVENTPNGNPSTLNLTNIELEVSQYIDPNTNTPDTPNLNTLNYLCETNGSTLPPPVPFNWNWVEKSEESSFDGVISINRDTFTNYFKSQLDYFVPQYCYLSFVRVWLSGAFDQNIHYSWQLTPGQNPTVTMPATGAEVLTYSYSSTYEDDAGAGGDMGKMRLSPSFNLSVNFTGNTIVITQTLLIYVYIRVMQSSEDWNAVNITITDTYDLAVDQYGSLTASLTSNKQDNSDPTPSANWFINLFTGLNDLVDDIQNWASGFASSRFQDIPVNLAQQFVFPGGNTFTFKDVVFSENQDLVSHISYVQPNSIELASSKNIQQTKK